MTENHSATLYTLGDHGQTVDGSANGVRGRHVKDKDGEGIGKVADLLVDDRRRSASCSLNAADSSASAKRRR